MVHLYPFMMVLSVLIVGLVFSLAQIGLTWTLIVGRFVFCVTRVILIFQLSAYFAFDQLPNDSPIATGLGSDAGGIWPAQACNAWGPGINTRLLHFRAWLL